MTTTSEPNDPLYMVDEALVDGWLADQHRDMGANLLAALELDVGLREIQLAGQYRDMGADLANGLKLAAGLAAILPPHKRHLALPSQFDDFTGLLSWLSAAPMVRLTHRHHLRLLALNTEILHLTTIRKIDHAVDRAADLHFLRDRTRQRGLIHGRRDLDRAVHHVLELVHALERTRADTDDLVKCLDRVLDHVLDDDFLRVLNLERKLGRAQDRVGVHDLGLVRDQARDLDRALDLADDIGAVESLVRLTSNRALDRLDVFTAGPVRELVLIPDEVKAVARNLADVQDEAHELAQLVCARSVQLEVENLLREINERTPMNASWLDSRTISPQQTNQLKQLAADFIGVDLREASLSGLDLMGVRWSRTTQWPQADVGWIVAASEPVGNGIYVVRESSAAGGAMVVPDPVSV
ncbi:hypothetical protein [Actinophytocola glycyrrhizae]|uniref:DUF222 domain-containing protein n=1 Tax=Actinophytocola glycyrrhizae TaxID=2044873 RepID=A0ABV9SG40_9PSEU